MIFNMFGEMNFHQFVQQSRLTNLSLNEQQKYYNNYLMEVAMHQQLQQQSVAVAAGVAANIVSSPTPTPTPTPTAAPTATPTPTPSQAFVSYNYSIAQADLDNATGNTGGNATYNNKIVVVITGGYNCGNTTPRNFTYTFDTAGAAYNSWLISPTASTPVFGYYRNNTLVTTGLVSTQTVNLTVPC